MLTRKEQNGIYVVIVVFLGEGLSIIQYWYAFFKRTNSVLEGMIAADSNYNQSVQSLSLINKALKYNKINIIIESCKNTIRSRGGFSIFSSAIN